MKKTLSVLMAVAMILALAIPAFAENDPSQASVPVTGETMAVDIKVTAPTSAKLILNPYQMKYTGDIEALENKQDQVMSPDAVFTNLTTAKLLVTGTFTATTKGIESVAAGAVNTAGNDGKTAKKANISVNFGMMESEEGKMSDTGKQTYEFPAFAAEASSGNAITLKEGENLAAPNYAAYEIAETDGEEPNYFGFNFTGSCTSAPSDPWAKTDTWTVAVALKFTPKALTVANANNNAGNNNGGGD